MLLPCCSTSTSPYAPRALAMPMAATGGMGLGFPVSEPTSPQAGAAAGPLASPPALPLQLPQQAGCQPDVLGLGTIDLGIAVSSCCACGARSACRAGLPLPAYVVI